MTAREIKARRESAIAATVRELAKSRRAAGRAAARVAALCANEGASLRAIGEASLRASLAIGRAAAFAGMLDSARRRRAA